MKTRASNMIGFIFSSNCGCWSKHGGAYIRQLVPQTWIGADDHELMTQRDNHVAQLPMVMENEE